MTTVTTVGPTALGDNSDYVVVPTALGDNSDYVVVPTALR